MVIYIHFINLKTPIKSRQVPSMKWFHTTTLHHNRGLCRDESFVVAQIAGAPNIVYIGQL
jgi:hypothetical protein